MASEKALERLITERMEWLLGLAEKSVKIHPDRAKRYVQLARKLSMRYRVEVPKRFKKRFCKVCNRYWIPGYNLSIRMNKRNRTVVYRCECGSVRTFGYKK
jgi:ribonuclease P protein subunit RPR2